MASGRLWDEGKNIARLAQIVGRLSWPVYFAGEGSIPPLENSYLLGRLSRSELASWLSRASIFASPARYEPFGLGILEAALSGCALVLGDIRSLRETWDGCALFVEPDCAEGLRDGIELLIANESLRTELGEKAYERALKFNASDCAEAYLNVYQEATCRREVTCSS